MADVEQAERGLVLDRRRLVFAQVLVVAPGLELLVAEILDRLVVQQAVDGPGIRLGIQLVRLAADRHAPLGDHHREADVDDHRAEGDGGEAPVELGEQHHRDQGELQDHWENGKDQVREQRRDAARAALDVARHAAGLPVEMEAQAQAVQMPEHAERNAPDRALRHRHEQHVAQLAEERRGEPQDSVDREQRDRHRDDRRLHVEPVDHLLHDERHADVGELRRDQAGERQQHAPLVLEQVRQERADRAPFVAPQLLRRCRVVCHGSGGFYLRTSRSTSPPRQ